MERGCSGVTGGRVIVLLLTCRSVCVYDINRGGVEMTRFDDKRLGVISSVSDDVSGVMGLSSYNGRVMLLDGRVLSKEGMIWNEWIGDHGIQEVSLKCDPLLLVNERYSGKIHCYDRRNLSDALFSVAYASGSNQVLLCGCVDV